MDLLKLNLTLNNQNTLAGYINLDAMIFEPGTSRIKIDLVQLDKYIDDSECKEILVNNILMYLDTEKIDTAIEHWIKKLAKGGTITFIDLDITNVFLAYQKGELDINQFNKLIYGNQRHIFDFKKSGLDMYIVSETLKNKGLKIVEKSFNNFNFLVKAQRIA